MKTNLGKQLLACLAGLVLAAGALSFRMPTVREVEPSAELRQKAWPPDRAPEPPQPQATHQSELRELESLPTSSTVVLPEDADEIRQWTREHSAKALAWLANAPSGFQRDTVVEIACAQVAETDPARAVALAERYAGGCSNLLENLVFQWSARNESAARAYALSQPVGEARDRLLSRVALHHSRANPVEAATLVIEEMSPGQVQAEAVMTVVHQWTLRDPSQVQAWVQLFPEGDLKIRAAKEIENLLGQPQSE